MPEMDGYTTAREIRKMEKVTGKHIPIIAMTAHALRGDKEKCVASGMDDYISKPIAIQTLNEKLGHWLGILPGSNISLEESKPSPIDGIHTTLIDFERIRVIFGDDPVGIHEFLKILFSSTSELLDQIHSAIEQKDEALSKQLFHRLKGSSSNAGMLRIAAICLRVEDNIPRGEWDEIKREYQAILGIFEQLKMDVWDKAKT
jgi:CheY-like chemotaxis protein